MRPIYISESSSAFKVQFEYKPILVEVIKRIPSSPRWNPREKLWMVNKISNAYSEEKNARWYVEAFAQWAVRYNHCSCICREDDDEEEQEFAAVEMGEFDGEHYMHVSPYQYQLQGVQYALDHKRCIFGDEPGLGKTLQALCTTVKAHREADKYGESYPVLVVCPSALKINWQREYLKFAGVNAVILSDKNKDNWHQYWEAKDDEGEAIAPVFITNYESLKKYFVKEIKPHKRFSTKSVVFDDRINLFNTVILDESHKCKSSQTKQSKFAEGICKDKRWVFALTGTPVVNNNTDLIQQLKILNRLDDFGGFNEFTNRYCAGARQSSRLKELNYKLSSTCYFMREKSKVLTQLPEKMRQYVTMEISNREEYEMAERDVISYLREYRDATDDKIAKAIRGEVMVKMGILKQISARGKIKAVADFIHSIIDGGEKLILFAFLKEVIQALKEEFPDAVTVTGSDNATQKQAAVDSFQNDPECKLIILNYKSGGTGLTLTASSRVGFIEFPWTYADCVQAEDRAHRNGQKNAVNCYYFIGEKTIDRYMYKVIQSKRDIAQKVTGTTTHIEEDVISLGLSLFADKL